MRVIAVSGYKRSGKDTIANYLVKNYGFKKVAFADPLKDLVARKFDIDRASLDDHRKEEPLLQYPVDPKDKFSQMIADFMLMEFKDENGHQYGRDYQDKTLYWTPRALAILEGSVNRAVNSSYWVKQAIREIQKGDSFDYVISDLRYCSEVSQLEEAFGLNLTTVRIDRFDSSPSVDPSERDLDGYEFDLTVSNRGSVKDLFIEADSKLFK